MTRFECRQAMHDSARHLRNLREGNPFAIAALSRNIANLESAYFSENCEESVSKRIMANLALIEEFVA